MIKVERTNLSPIVDLFHTEQVPSKLRIEKENKEYRVSLVQFVPGKNISSTEDQQSLENLNQLIGAQRVYRIFQREELKKYQEAFNQRQLLLDRKVIEIIFLLLGDVRTDDLQEATTKPLSALDPLEIDKLYFSLIPFHRVNNLFFRNIPENAYFDSSRSSGRGLEGLRERIKIQLDAIDFYLPSDQTGKWAYEVEVLTSRLADREMATGQMIRCSSGYFKCEAIFTGKGGYAAFLRDLREEKTMLVCRGTASRRSATGGLMSGLNNLLIEPGMLAVQALWPQIRTYLSDHNISHIDLYGKSQGGAQVQYLASLIHTYTTTRVTSLTTYASIGVNREVEEIFYNTFKDTDINVSAIVNEGVPAQDEWDCIPLVGGVHVGLRLPSASAYSLLPSSTQRGDIKTLSVFQKIKGFFKSFSKAHIRQTTLKPFRIEKMENTRHYFSLGLELEHFRKVAAWIVHILTLGLFNPISYKRYFESFSKT